MPAILDTNATENQEARDLFQSIIDTDPNFHMVEDDTCPGRPILWRKNCALKIARVHGNDRLLAVWWDASCGRHSQGIVIYSIGVDDAEDIQAAMEAFDHHGTRLA